MAAELDPGRFAVRRARVRDFEMAWVREGEGAPLLLVHGWLETLRIWWRNLAPLAEAGFGVVAPDLRDGSRDVASHSRDLYALVHDHLGLARVAVVAGDLGGAIAQDLSLRFPGFVERMVLFNCPLPGLPTRAPFVRPRELDTPERRRRYVAGFYTSGFRAEEVDFMTEPFADGAKLRASVDVCESSPLWGENPTPTLILVGAEDEGIGPDFEAMAKRVFPDHRGPFRVPGAGHFLQWEAAEVVDGAIRHLCRAEPRPSGPEEIVFVGLGSNLGPRERHLAGAVAALRDTRGVRDVVVSPVYETEPVGPGVQGPYLNAVARLRTTLPPRELLEQLLAIESRAGRQRGPERNAARTLDLDLLLWGECRVREPGLEIPHPRLHERGFVLEPLCDLAPRAVHPVLTVEIEELARRVRDPESVRRRA